MERRKNKIPKLNIRKGDIVKVIAGDYRGQQGRVLSVIPAERKAFVEGINIATKHTRPTSKNTQGGIMKQESSIHISNLLVIDGKGNATRVGRREEEGKLVRYSKKSGEVIKS